MPTDLSGDAEASKVFAEVLQEQTETGADVHLHLWIYKKKIQSSGSEVHEEND